MANYDLTTSSELSIVQKYLTSKLLNAVEAYDFALVSSLAVEIGELDIKRRDLWNKEKFGGYEEVAANVLGLLTEQDFNASDIPFQHQRHYNTTRTKGYLMELNAIEFSQLFDMAIISALIMAILEILSIKG